MKILLKSLCLLWLLTAYPALAEEYEPVQDPHIAMRVVDPERDVGYLVGDVLPRTITLEAKKPYLLVDTSLPIVGYEKKYKGHGTGIELRAVSMQQSTAGDKTIYTLHLDYQVFTTNRVARPAALPAETVKFSGEHKMFEIRIPSWGFRISPLAVFGSVKLEQDMSPYRSPLLIDTSAARKRLTVLLAIFGISLLGLLYVLGANTWLPRMGGPFAKAYRDLRKIPSTEAGLQQGLARLHQAFNTTAGGSVFSDSLESFLLSKPGFVPIRYDIERFFGMSDNVFFASATSTTGESPLLWLREFCRKCRNCERGLK